MEAIAETPMATATQAGTPKINDVSCDGQYQGIPTAISNEYTTSGHRRVSGLLSEVGIVGFLSATVGHCNLIAKRSEPRRHEQHHYVR